MISRIDQHLDFIKYSRLVENTDARNMVWKEVENTGEQYSVTTAKDPLKELYQLQEYDENFTSVTSLIKDKGSTLVSVINHITSEPSISVTQISSIKFPGFSRSTTLAHKMISVFTVGEEEPKYDKGNHNIMLAILLGIFMCITIVITVSVFVFCRKKNSVFMLQKCEQEDSDLELNDINTEPESSTDSEYEYIESSSPVKTETAKMRSSSSPNLNQHASDNNHNGEESLRAVKNETMKSKGSNKKTSLKKAKYKSDVPASQNDNSAAPLLNAKNTEGNKKSSRSSQTVRKLTCQSRSMPIIYENPQNKTDMSSFSVVNEMRDSSQNVNFQNNEQEVSIHNKRSQKKSKHSRKHIYTRVELHAPYIDGASEVVSDIQMETDLSESILGNMKFYRRNSKEEICIIPELETSPNTNCVCLPNSMRELKKLDPTHQKAIKDGSALTKESTHDTKHRDTGGIDIKYSNMGDIDTKYSNMGDIDTKYSNMGNIDTKYSNLRETDTKYSNMEDIDT